MSFSQLEILQENLSSHGVKSSIPELRSILSLAGYEISQKERTVSLLQTDLAKPASRQSPTSIQDPSLTSNNSQSYKKEGLSGFSLKEFISPESNLPQKEMKSFFNARNQESTFSPPLSKGATQSLNPNTPLIPESNNLRFDSVLNVNKTVTASEWAPVVVDKNSFNWSKELVSSLGDRLKMQVSQNVKEASVRLDPPELGRVDFSVKVDGDKVSVQINSGSAQVREILSQQIERLRNDIASQGDGSLVDVNVGDGKSKKQQGESLLFDNNDQTSVILDGNDLKSDSEINTYKNKTGLNTKA